MCLNKKKASKHLVAFIKKRIFVSLLRVCENR